MTDDTGKARTTVFISYGRKDALDFAKDLAGKLRDSGYNAWLDIDNGIVPGDRFDVKIELGIRKSDVLLAVLSQWSTRDSSFCRNEILYAQAHNRPIIPVRIAEVDRPIQIYSAHYIDVEADGEAAIDQIFAVLAHLDEHGSLPPGPSPSPASESWRSWLRGDVEDVTGELAEHLGRFSGREWLFERVERWLETGDTQLMLMLAPPGYGKSAVCAKLTAEFEVLSCQFCRSTRTRSCEPAPWILGMVQQLAGQLDPYRKEISGLATPDFEDTSSLFRDLVADPLKRCANQLDIRKPRLVVVDGLDEAVAVYGPKLMETILEAIPHLPEWLRILVTSRPDRTTATRFRTVGATVTELRQEAADNLRDIEAYVAATLRSESAESTSPEGWDELSRKLLEESGGNFQFVALSLDALIDPDPMFRLTPAEIGNLPGRLHGLYHLMFSKRFPNIETYEEVCGPILDCLSAARGPLPAESLSAMCGLGTRVVRRGLRTISQFMVEGKAGLEFFHKSLAEWLADEAASCDFAVDHEEGQKRLHRYCMDQHSEGSAAMSQYAVRHILGHACAAGTVDELLSIVEDVSFLERYASSLGVGELLRDLDRVRDLVENTPGDVAAGSSRNTLVQTITLLVGALRLSAQALAAEPRQLPAQLAARLWTFDDPSIRRLLDRIESGAGGRLHSRQSPLRKPDSPQLLGFRPHGADLCWTRLDPASDRFFTLSTEGELKVWETGTCSLVSEARLPIDGSIGSDPLLSHDGSRLAVNCGSRVIVWDISNAGLRGEIRFPESRQYGFRSLRTPARSAASPNVGQPVDHHEHNVLWFSTDLEFATSLVRYDRVESTLSPAATALVCWSAEAGYSPTTHADVSNGIHLFCMDNGGTMAALGMVGNTIQVRDLATGMVQGVVRPRWSLRLATAVVLEKDRLVVAFENLVDSYDFVGGGEEMGAPWSPVTVGHTADGLLYIKEHTNKQDRNVGRLRIFTGDASAGTMEFEGHLGTPICRPALGRLLSCRGNELILHDVATGREAGLLRGHTGAITSVSVSAEGDRVLTGSADNTVRLWSLGGESAERGELAADAETTLHLIPDAGLVLHSLGRSATVYDTGSGLPVDSVSGYHGFLERFASSTDGRMLATGGDEGDVLLWNAADWTVAATLHGRGPSIEGLRFLADDSRLVSISADGRVVVWSVSEARVVGEYAAAPNSPIAVVSQNDNRFAFADADGCVMVLDAENDETLFRCEGLANPVIRIAFTPDGRRIITGSTDDTVRVWDVETGLMQRTIPWAPVIRVPLHLLSPRKRRAGSVAKARIVRGFDGDSWSRPDANLLVIGADGVLLAVPTDSHGVAVWSLETGALVQEMEGHKEKISSILFLPDAKRIVTAAYDRFIRIWDVRGGTLVDSFMVDAPVSSVVLDEAERQIIAADESGMLHFLRLPEMENRLQHRPSRVR